MGLLLGSDERISLKKHLCFQGRCSRVVRARVMWLSSRIHSISHSFNSPNNIFLALDLNSNHNPLDFIEGDLIVAAVVKTRCAGGLVIGHLLSHFELAPVP